MLLADEDCSPWDVEKVVLGSGVVENDVATRSTVVLLKEGWTVALLDEAIKGDAIV